MAVRSDSPRRIQRGAQRCRYQAKQQPPEQRRADAAPAPVGRDPKTRRPRTQAAGSDHPPVLDPEVERIGVATVELGAPIDALLAAEHPHAQILRVASLSRVVGQAALDPGRLGFSGRSRGPS